MAKTLDLRTYLLLERAFVRRLQRSWRTQSAPIYARITQACLDHKWDEARRLVPDLDMAEVGTKNREWITYMLRSFAVFGAGTVAKKKPSFVGVGTFDTFLKQVTQNMLQYLEYTATSQIQAQALHSIAEDEAQTKALPKIAYDPNQARDAQGQWVETGAEEAGAVGRALIKAGRTTTDPNLTFFLLPDGTRITAGGYNSHAKLAMAAGYNDLNKVIESGIVRYIPGVGIEANHLTEKQAAIIVDDWEANFAGPHGWNAMQVDLIGRGDRLGLGLEALSHRFDRLSVDALLNFVNGRTTKWDESKHPRDKEGQFTEAGAVPTEPDTTSPVVPPVEGGGGPQRQRWEHLLVVSIAADKAFLAAREAHAPPTVLEAAEEAAKEAEKAFIAQIPAMKIEVVTTLAAQVAQEMGVPAFKIDVVDKNPREFQVGDKVFSEGGHYDPSDERIELNVRHIDYRDAPAVKGMAAHELSHYVYHAMKRVADREFQRYLKKAVTVDGKSHTPWYYERFEDVTGGPFLHKRVKPEFREEMTTLFPAAMAMAELAEGEVFAGISNRMKTENGHSAYAKSYWHPEAIKAKGGYEEAINETIAEVTRYLTAPRSWDEETTPDPTSPWVTLTKGMHQWYAERRARIAAMAGNNLRNFR